MELILLLIIIVLLLTRSSNEQVRNNGCVNVPVANFKPPTPPKPSIRPPSQYKKIQIPKESICKLNECKYCKNKEE